MKNINLISTAFIIGFIAILNFGCEKAENEKSVSLAILTSDTITLITQTTAIVKSEIVSNGGGAITANGVCWSTSQSPTITDNKSIDSIGVASFGIGAVSYTNSISGLSANTKYYVRAYATNISGTSYGNVLSFNTLKPFPANGSIIRDIDNNIYHTIIIGNQVWSLENLKTSKYRNGDPIINFTDTAKWAWNGLTSGAYSNYNNDTSISNIYGKLYNWFAINDKRGICPNGWHIPTENEWNELINYLGGNSDVGGKLKETGILHWVSPNTGATNESGFTALPSGYREIDGTFQGLGHVTYIWSSTDVKDFGLGWSDKTIGSINSDKHIGLPVRYVMDK